MSHESPIMNHQSHLKYRLNLTYDFNFNLIEFEINKIIHENLISKMFFKNIFIAVANYEVKFSNTILFINRSHSI
jgi:hypothetical protein